MLSRKLRQDRHPRHAAEVRENLVPGMLLVPLTLKFDHA